MTLTHLPGRTALLLFCLAATQFGCSSGSNDPDPAAPTPDPVATQEIVVTPSLGRINRGIARAFSVAGTPLSDAVELGDDGKGTLEIPATHDAPLIVEVSGSDEADYFDEGANTTVPFPADQRIRAALPGPRDEVGIHILTELALRLLEASGEEFDLELIELANERIRAALADDVDDLLSPPFIVDGSTASGDLDDDDAGRLAARLGALAMLAAGDATPALTMLRQLAADVTNGSLDGFADGAAIEGLVYDPATFAAAFVQALRDFADAFGSEALKQRAISANARSQIGLVRRPGATEPASINPSLAGDYLLTYFEAVAGGPFMAGETVMVIVGADDTLKVGDLLLTDPFHFIQDDGFVFRTEINWLDADTGIVYGLSNNESGVFNDLNLGDNEQTQANGLPLFLGQLFDDSASDDNGDGNGGGNGGAPNGSFSGVRVNDSQGNAVTELAGIPLDRNNCSGCTYSVSGARQLADGKLLVIGNYTGLRAGNSVREWHVVRIDIDSLTVDTSYGDSGRLIHVGGNLDENFPSFGFDFDAEERLLLLNDIPGSGRTVSRIDTDGTPDTSFGSNGSVTLPGNVGTGSTIPTHRTLAVLPDGRIAVGGRTGPITFNGPRNWLIAVLSASGSFDSAVGEGGEVTFTPPIEDPQSEIRMLKVMGDHLYATGVAGDTIFAARFAPDTLELDTTYGSEGFIEVLSGTSIAINDMMLDDQGRLVLVGTGPGQGSNVWSASAGQAFHIYRYLPSGAADSSFGSGGLVKVDFGDSGRQTQIQDDVATQVMAAAGGRLLVTGHSYSRTSGSSSNRRFAMTRLHADGSLDDSFFFVEERLRIQLTGSLTFLRGGPINKQQTAVVAAGNRLIGVSTSGDTWNGLKPETPIALRWWE